MLAIFGPRHFWESVRVSSIRRAGGACSVLKEKIANGLTEAEALSKVTIVAMLRSIHRMANASWRGGSISAAGDADVIRSLLTGKP